MESFANFLLMRSELSLLAILAFLLIYDLVAGEKGLKHFQLLAVVLLTIHTILHLYPQESFSAFGGMYVNTPIGGIVKTILDLATLILFLQGEAFNVNNMRDRRGEYYFLTLVTLLGFHLMISSGHFLLFYIGLEMASIPMGTLAAMDKQSKKSAEAGAKYILLATFSSGIMLFGISYLYGATGTLYFADLGRLIDVNPLTIMAFLFFISGLFFKISLVPFHMWTPDVYEGAPTSVTAYLSVVSKGAALIALCLLLYKVFGNLASQWQTVLYGLIIASITLANLFAIRQKDIKRFMAYSSISQAGYIVLGMIGGTAFGMSTVVYYLFVYLFANLAAFGVIGTIENHTGKTGINDYKGLYHNNPKLSFVMMLAMFSLGGIPPLAGFFSKFFVFAAAIEKGYYLLVIIAVLNTIISLYYYLLVVKAMFIDQSRHPVPRLRSDKYHRIAFAFCTAGILFAGIVSFFMEKIDTFSFALQ